MGLKNKEGLDIKEVWKDGIRTYLGMTIGGFPNLFMSYTPHGTLAIRQRFTEAWSRRAVS